MPSVRTRFAPSPTGALHLGNLRVAVFNWLFARRHAGEFMIRVEDTDTERNLPGALDGILSDLRWAGLDWDEGPEVGGPHAPYRQSERGDLYRGKAEELERTGRAYRCFCTDEAIEAARATERTDPRCPGGCRALEASAVAARREAGETPVLRFAVPTEHTSIEDEVRGTITFSGHDIGDFVILRGDGRATYNFAVVVDDVDMRITHVIRGSGHLSNTPKQALLFDALGADRPSFAHLPMVLDEERKKLSKRKGAEGLARLREEGFHPDGVVNYLSLLGWSAGDDREVLSRDELIEAMDLGRVGASDTVFDLEKLRWVSAQHIAHMPLEDLAEAVFPWVDQARYPLTLAELAPALEAIRTRITVFGEVNQHLALLFPEAEPMNAARAELAGEGEHVPALLADLIERLGAISSWQEEPLGETVREAGRASEVRGKALFHPVRLALTGSRTGPDLGKVLAGLGRDRALHRLRAALERIQSGGGGEGF